MIDLTPLDVRKKSADFRRGLRGYEPAEVEGFLELVAERLEELVRENNALRDRASQLTEELVGLRGRDQAINEALVSAQQLREEIRAQAQRESELTVREAKTQAERLLGEALRAIEREREALQRVQTQRDRFLRAYRAFLEGQLGEVAQEEEKVVRARTGELASELYGDGEKNG